MHCAPTRGSMIRAVPGEKPCPAATRAHLGRGAGRAGGEPGRGCADWTRAPIMARTRRTSRGACAPARPQVVSTLHSTAALLPSWGLQAWHRRPQVHGRYLGMHMQEEQLQLTLACMGWCCKGRMHTCCAVGQPGRRRVVDERDEVGGVQVLGQVLDQDAQEQHCIGGVLRPVPVPVRPRQQLHHVVRQGLEVVRCAVVVHCTHRLQVKRVTRPTRTVSTKLFLLVFQH